MFLAALDPEVAAWLSWATAASIAANCVGLAAWNAFNRRRIGGPRVVVLRRRGFRLAALVALALVALWLALAPTVVPKLPGLVALALGMLAIAIGPGFDDSVVAEHGVRRGFHARRFEELEEWRLIGDHLRWKLHGVWVASDLPKDQHAAMRETLVKLCPDRESRFNQ